MNPYYVQSTIRSTTYPSSNLGQIWLGSLPLEHCKALKEVQIISSIRGMQPETAALWVKLLCFEKLGLASSDEGIERYDWGTKIVVKLERLDP